MIQDFRLKIKDSSGFTIIELLTVMGILTLLAGWGVVLSLGDYREFAFRNEKNMVIALLQKARSQAVNNVCLGSPCSDGKNHGVYFGSAGNYIVFQGASYDDTPQDQAVDQSIAANYGVSLSFVGLTGSQVVFSSLSGQVAAFVTTPGKIIISDPVGHSSTITINGEGRIDW